MSRFNNPLKIEKRERVPTYNMTQAQLDAVREEGFRAGISTGIYYANGMLSAAWLLQLRDTYGFGQRRLQRVFSRVQKLFSEIVEHRVAYSELAQVLMDECRINLVVERPDDVKTSALDLFAEMEAPARVVMEVKPRV